MAENKYGLVSSPASFTGSAIISSSSPSSSSSLPFSSSSSLHPRTKKKIDKFAEYAAAAQSRPVSYARLHHFIDQKTRAPWRIIEDLKSGKSPFLPSPSSSSSSSSPPTSSAISSLLSSSSSPPPSLFPSALPHQTVLNSITPFDRFDRLHSSSSLIDLEQREAGGYAGRDWNRREVAPFIFGGVLYSEEKAEEKLSKEHRDVLEQRRRNKEARRKHISECESLHFSVLSAQPSEGSVRERKESQKKMPASGCIPALESTFDHLFGAPQLKVIKPRLAHWDHQKRATSLWDDETKPIRRSKTAPTTTNGGFEKQETRSETVNPSNSS